MKFDVAGARKAGYSDAEIVEHLKSDEDFAFDVEGARKAGYKDDEITSYIESQGDAVWKSQGMVSRALSAAGEFLGGAVQQTKEDLGFGGGVLDSEQANRAAEQPSPGHESRASPVAPMRADHYEKLREASIADPKAAAKRAQVPDTTGRALTHIEDRRNARLEGQPSTSLSDIVDDQQVAPRSPGLERWSVARELKHQGANLAIGMNNLVKGFISGQRMAELGENIAKFEKKYPNPEGEFGTSAGAMPPEARREYESYKSLFEREQRIVDEIDHDNAERFKQTSPAVQKLFSLQGKEWNADTLSEIGDVVTSNPRVIVDIAAQSGPASVAMIVGAIAARGAGASLRGAAVAGGGASGFMEFGNAYVENRAEGMGHEEAYKAALAKGGMIGVFDAASLASAGRALGNVLGKGGVTRKVWETTKELGKQAAYGAAGEAAGSLAAGKTPDPVDVAAEALGELATGPVEIATMGRGGAKPAEEQPGDRSPVDASRVLGRPDEALGEPSGGPVEAGVAGTGAEPSVETGVPPAPPSADAGVRTPITERASELTAEHDAAAKQRDDEQERLVAEAGIRQAMTDEIRAAEASPAVDLATGTEQRSRPAGFERLAQHLSADAQSRGESSIDLTPVEPARVVGSLQRAAKFIEDAFGKKTVFVEADPTRFEGLVFPDDPSTIYVNTKSNRAVRRVMFHETLHTLKRSNPKVYGNLLRALKGAVDFGAIAEEYGSRYGDRPQTEQVEEFAADLFGNFADDPRMWFQVFRATEKSAVKALYKSVVMALDIIRMKMRIGERKSGYRASEMVRDIEGVRRAIAQAYADFHGGKEPSTEQANESDDAAGTSEKRSILDFFANKDMKLFDEVQAEVEALRRQFPGYEKRDVEAKIQQLYAHRKNPKLVREVVDAMYSRPSGVSALVKKLPKTEKGEIKGAGGMGARDVWNLVQKMESMAREGRGYAGWYKDSAEEILKAFNGNKRAAEIFVQVIAITSANTEVRANFTQADKAMFQYARGEPISVGTAAVDAKLNDLLYFGIPWEGRKTNTFYRNLVEAINGQRSKDTTQDMHMGMLAFGKKQLSNDEYTFLDLITKHVAKRVQMRPLEAQAAVWVVQKARSLMERYEVMGFHSDKTPQAKRRMAIADAGINYGALVRKRGWFWPEPGTRFEPAKDVRAKGVSVTAEVKPSTTLDIGKAVQNLSVARLQAYQKDALARTFGAKGPAALMEAMGLDRSKYRIVEGAGGYDSMLAPNEIITLNSDVETATRVAKAWMYIFRQDAVPYFRADDALTDDPNSAQGVKIVFAEKLTNPLLRTVYDSLRAQVAPGIGLTKLSDTEIAVVNFRGDDGKPFLMADSAFLDGMQAAISGDALGVKIADHGRFGAETAYPFHDWQAEPDGAALHEAVAGDRPDLQERLRRWADNFGRYAAARARQGSKQEVASKGPEASTPSAQAGVTTPLAASTSEPRAPVARALLSKPDPEPEVPAGIVDSLMQYIADRGKVNDRHGAADVVDHLSKKHLPELLATMDKIGPEKRPTVLLHPGDEAKGIPTVWLLGWSTKEGTDIHDHGRSEAGVRVIRGQIKERVFGVRGNNAAEDAKNRVGVDAYAHERHLRDGSTVALPTPYIHEFFGDSSDVRDVTLHAYFPPLVEMSYFRFTNGKLIADGHWKQDDEEAEKARIAKEAEKQKVLFSRPSVLKRTAENLEQLQLGLGQWAPTKLGELKARGFDTSKVLYHQTTRANAASIKKTGFDLEHVGARRGDDEVPDGVFLKPTPRDIGVSDRFEPAEQLPVHVRFGKIATFANREAIKAHLVKDEVFASMQREREELLQKAKKEFASALADNDMSAAGRIERQHRDDVEKIAARARARATEIFKRQGVSTVIIKDDEGGGGRHVQTVIALSGNQIALAEGQEHRVLFSRPFKEHLQNKVEGYKRATNKSLAAAEPIGVLEKLPEKLDFLKRPDGTRLFARGPVIGTVSTIYLKGSGQHRSATEGREAIPMEVLGSLDDLLRDPIAVYRNPPDHPVTRGIIMVLAKTPAGNYVTAAIDPDAKYAGHPVNFIKTVYPKDAAALPRLEALKVYGNEKPPVSSRISAEEPGAGAGAADRKEVAPPKASVSVDDDAHKAATSPRNDLSEPSDKQKQAGNYIKGHPRLAGMSITIENPAGSERSGTDANGRKWSVTMTDHYGYIRGTEDRTGEQIDAFVKVGTEKDWTGPVFVANTNKVKTKRFDEYKVFIGWDTMEAARDSLAKNYSKGWDGLRSMVRFDTPEQFKAWLENGDTKKPATLQSRPFDPGRRRFIRDLVGVTITVLAPSPAVADSKFVVKSGESGASVMKRLAAATTNHEYRKLALRLAPLLKDVEYKVIEPGRRYAEGFPGALAVAAGVTAGPVKGRPSVWLRSDVGLVESTVLHEGIHAAAWGVSARAPGMVRLENLRKLVREKVAPKDLSHLFIRATEHVEEFIAYGMTEPEFQDILRSIKLDSKMSAWDSFIDSIMRALGLRDVQVSATVLDEVMSAGYSALDSAAAAAGAAKALHSRPARSRMTPAHEKEIRRIAQRVSDRVAERHNLPQRPLSDKKELTEEEQADLDLMKDSLYDIDPDLDPTELELSFQQSVLREAMPELSGRARPGARFIAQLVWAKKPKDGDWESADGRYKIMQFADGFAFYLDGVEKSFHRVREMAQTDAELTFFEEARTQSPKNPIHAKSIMAQFSEEVRQRVTDGWRRLAENKMVFRFRSSDKKDIAAIIAEMGNASVVTDVHDHGGFLKINFKDGTFADLVMPAEGVAFLQASQLHEGSQMGPVLYQAALVWAKNNRRKLVPDPSGLSYINSFRRTEQMLSGALRLGTTKYMRPHADQGLYGWIDDPKTQADDDHNIALMALTSMRNASEEVGIDGLRYNFDERRMEEEISQGKWKPLAKDEIEDMAKSPDARNAGFGRTTLARAIFTKSLVEEVAGAKKFVKGDIPVGLILAGDTSQSLALYSVPDRFAPKGPGAGKRAVLATAKVATQIAKPFAATADAINATADLVSKIAGKPLSYITSRMYDRLTTYGGRFMEGGEARQNIKHGMVSDYGLPEPYIEHRDQRDIGIQKTLRKSKQLIDNIAALDDDERRVAYVWMQEKPNEAAEQRLLALLPDGSRQALAEMKQQIDQLGREAVELGLLSQDSYERNKMAYLARSYEKHVLRDKQAVAGSTRAKAIRAERFRGRGLRDDVALDRLPGAAKGDYYIRLEKRDAAPAGELGPLHRVVYLRAGQPIPATYSGWRNDGVWEVRFTDRPGVLGLWRDFTRAERERMGEVQEVAFAFAKSVIGLVHDIETAKFLKWVMETYSVADAEEVVNRGGKVADAVDKMTTLTTYGNDEWVQVPGTMAQGTRLYKYGLLQSRYIPGHIWNDIRATVNFRSASAMFRLYDQLLTAWKISKTALSPVVHTNNVMANFVFMDLADVKHTHLIRALQTIIDAERGKEDARATMERYLDSGAELGTPALHELKREVIEPLLAKIAGEENEVLASVGLIQAVGLAARGNVRQAWAALAASKTAQIAAKPFHTMLAAYQLEDSVYRMATWLKEVDEGKSDRQAGADARKAFLDYRINAPWIASLRRGPLPFIAFTYRAVPLLAEGFAKKPWKLLKYMAVAHALNGIAYALLGLAGDDVDEDKERKLLPDEKSGYTILGVPRLLRMPWNDKHGNPVFLDIRRWIPAGDIYDVSGSQGAIPTPTWLSLGGYWGLAVELASNKSQFTGRDIWSDSDSLGERVAKVMDHLFKFVTPNVPLPNPLGYALDAAVVERGLLQTYAWKSIQDAGTGATDDFGREKSLAQSAASAVGVKVASYPKDQLERNLRARRGAELRALNETTAKYRRENRRTTDEAQKKLFEERMQKQAAKRAEINKRYDERLSEPEGLEPITR